MVFLKTSCVLEFRNEQTATRPKCPELESSATGFMDRNFLLWLLRTIDTLCFIVFNIIELVTTQAVLLGLL